MRTGTWVGMALAAARVTVELSRSVEPDLGGEDITVAFDLNLVLPFDL